MLMFQQVLFEGVDSLDEVDTEEEEQAVSDNSSVSICYNIYSLLQEFRLD